MRKSLLLLALLPAVPAHAQTQLKSAREILANQLPKPEDEGMGMDTSNVFKYAPDSAAGQWVAQVQKFRRSMGINTPAQNARTWLALAQRRLEIPLHDARTYDNRPTFSALVKALPSPAAWPALLSQAKAKYTKAPTQANAINYYFVARVQNSPGDQVQALRGIYRLLAPQVQTLASSPQPTKFGDTEKRRIALEKVNHLCTLMSQSPDVSQKVAGLKLQIQAASLFSPYQQFEIPNVLASMDEKVAAPLLKQLMLSKANIAWYNAYGVEDLARKLWLSDPQLQKKPYWELINSVKAWKFADKMLQLYPTPPKDGVGPDAVNRARSYVIGGLLSEKRFSEATQRLDKWLASSPQSAAIYFPYIEEKQPRELQLQQLRWVESTIKKHPGLNWREGHSYLALRLGETKSRLKMLQAFVAQKSFGSLSPGRRHDLLRALSDAYLTEGDTNNGGAALVKALRLNLQGKIDSEEEIVALLRLNRVAPNPAWLSAARDGAKAFAASVPSYDRSRRAKTLMQICLRLAEQKQVAFAQSLLVKELTTKTKNKPGFLSPEDDRAGAQTSLYGLMVLYQRANRPADMVYLLEHAQGWDQKELTPLLTYDGSEIWDYEIENPESKAMPKLGYLAAWALARTNRRAEALRVTKALIDRAPGYDSPYRLLCDLQGEAARPFLQQATTRDRFEERPLIWQAYLSRRSKKWAQAQQLAKKAIAIDPSDGEQGPGDRLRAYAELAAAQRGAGQVAKAKEVETAVSAIRLAERADYLRIAGLSLPAIAMYKQSLSYFDDAYCVQSRLAVQLTGLGKYQEAAGHFRRAYELMPVSFGRLESHCFGCEGVFGGKEQNSIAKEVFLKLEKERPNDPKIAYLSGYWRYTTETPKSAMPYFEKAVKLDPLYLSAWKKLSESEAYLTPAQYDAAVLNIIKLDPRGAHEADYGVAFDVKGNYRGLWETTATVLPRKTITSKAQFPLKKSSRYEGWSEYSSWDLVNKPADAIALQAFVTQLSNLS